MIVVKWNKNWEVVTGYTSAEIAKMYGPDFFHGSDKAHIAERMQKVFVEGFVDAEAALVTKQGKKIPCFSVSWRPKPNAPRNKDFYISQYHSEEEAFQAAVKFRREKEAELDQEVARKKQKQRIEQLEVA